GAKTGPRSRGGAGGRRDDHRRYPFRLRRLAQRGWCAARAGTDPGARDSRIPRPPVEGIGNREKTHLSLLPAPYSQLHSRSLFPIPCSLLPVPCPTPYSLFPTPYSLLWDVDESRSDRP